MKPLIPNTFVLNNKYLQPILSPSTDIIDYNFSSDQVHKLNLLQILRPDIYFNKKLSDDEFYNISKGYYQKLINEEIIYKSENDYYLYRIDSENHSQTGLISLLNIQDYVNNSGDVTNDDPLYQWLEEYYFFSQESHWGEGVDGAPSRSL